MSGTSDDAYPRRLSEISFIFDRDLIEQTKSEPYDGILGTLPPWVPESFNVEFCSIRNRLLHKYSRDGLLASRDGLLASRDDLLAIINAMRETVGIGGVLAAVESFDELGAPGDPNYRDIAILARYREVVALGPENGLALLTDQEHAKTAKIGASNRRGQSKKAKLLRGKVGDAKASFADILSQLASARDELGDFIPAPDLWEPLFDKLGKAGGDPKLTRNPTEPRKSSYEYSADGKNRHITRGHFETRIGELRR